MRDSEKSTRQVGYEPTKKCQKQQVERIEQKERTRNVKVAQFKIFLLASRTLSFNFEHAGSTSLDSFFKHIMLS